MELKRTVVTFRSRIIRSLPATTDRSSFPMYHELVIDSRLHL